MIESMIWLNTAAGRDLAARIARGEPSHIHLPRRRRAARPTGQDISPTWPADVGTDELCPDAHAVVTDA